jgi:hypothetical protein
MYGVTGDDATGRRQIGRCFPINWNSVVQLCPPARPYIKRSFEGILMYALAGDYINKYCNYADPTTGKTQK